MPIEMTVSTLLVDPATSTPIVVLKNAEGDRLLPIWVGPFEAQAIAMKRESIEAPRPMTHDLLAATVRELGAVVEKVVIHDLREGTFFALVHLRRDDQRLAVDSRPSDAIALALRAEAPIYVEPLVLDKSAALDSGDRGEEADLRLRKWFEQVDPDDFSKYKM